MAAAETPLDAYSRVVTEVARALAPSVANLRVSGRAPRRGCLVGVNTAVAGVGLGLAVPINEATRAILAALIRDGRVRRAYLGIAGGSRPVPPRVAATLGRRQAIEVVEVVAGSPAERAGLRP